MSSIISISLSFVAYILLRPSFLQCFCSSVFVKLLRKSFVDFCVYMVSSRISFLVGFLGECWDISGGGRLIKGVYISAKLTQ